MQTLEDKQIFLRRQIIQSGIDPQAFMDYIGTFKQEGENVNLQNWTIAQLQKVVKQFKEDIDKQKKQLMNSRLSKDIKKSKIFQSKVKQEGTNLWDFQLDQERDCGKLNKLFKFPQFQEPKIKIYKSEVKSVGGFMFGFGARNQLQMYISTNFTQNKVIRKGEDCDWLKNILTQTFPGFFVPPLQKQRQLYAEDKKGIAARVSQIQRFLNSVIQYEIFQTSNFLKIFLSEPIVKKFHSLKNKQGSLIDLKDYDNIESISGKVHISVSEFTNKKMKMARQISADISSLYSQLQNCNTKIQNQMQSLSKSLKFMREVISKLNEKYSDSAKLLNITDIRLPTLFLSFSQLVQITNKNLKRHLRAFNQFSQTYVKETASDWKQFLIYNKKVNHQAKNYLNFKQNLSKRKQKYWNDISKWQLPQSQFLQLKSKGTNKLTKQQSFNLMFPADTQQQNKQKIWLAYVNQNHLNSLKQLLLLQQKDLIAKYTKYSGQTKCLNQEIITSFSQINQIIFS